MPKANAPFHGSTHVKPAKDLTDQKITKLMHHLGLHHKKPDEVKKDKFEIQDRCPEKGVLLKATKDGRSTQVWTSSRFLEAA